MFRGCWAARLWDRINECMTQNISHPLLISQAHCSAIPCLTVPCSFISLWLRELNAITVNSSLWHRLPAHQGTESSSQKQSSTTGDLCVPSPGVKPCLWMVLGRETGGSRDVICEVCTTFLAKRTRSWMRDQLPKLQCVLTQAEITLWDPWGRADWGRRRKAQPFYKEEILNKRRLKWAGRNFAWGVRQLWPLLHFRRMLSSHPPVTDWPWPSPTHARISFLFWCHWEGSTSAPSKVFQLLVNPAITHRVRDTAGLGSVQPKVPGGQVRPDGQTWQCCSCSFLSFSCMWTCSWHLAVLKDEFEAS